MDMVKTTHVSSGPRDFFLHLLATGTLFASIISFIALLFQYINALFPDQITYALGSIADSIRWSTSVLVIVFPVFILVSWLIGRDIAQEPEKRDIRIRRWLLHFTLFIAALTIIIDLVTIVYNFLNGESSLQFYLKTLVVLIITAKVFVYYIWELRRTAKASRWPRIAAITTSVVILVSIVGGFLIIGTPATQRARRFDDQRINSLQILQNEVINYWVTKGQLPATLGLLNNNVTGFQVPTDPVTNVAYGYDLLDPLNFELCATFETSALNNQNNSIYPRTMPMMIGRNGSYDQNWNHDRGPKCFKRTIDPSLYKPPAPVTKPL